MSVPVRRRLESASARAASAADLAAEALRDVEALPFKAPQVADALADALLKLQQATARLDILLDRVPR